MSHVEDLLGHSEAAIATAERALALSKDAHARRWLSQLCVKGGRSCLEGFQSIVDHFGPFWAMATAPRPSG